MNIDIEKYLNNEMSEAERLAFEQQLQSDPALQRQLDEQRVFLERLKSQMLREKIAAAIANGGGGNPPQHTTKKKWVFSLFILLFLTVGLLWFFYPNNDNEIAIPIDDPLYEEPQPADVEDVAEPPTQKEAEQETPEVRQIPQRPIAENPTTQPPPKQSGVRGDDANREDWDKLVESVWVTRFEPLSGEFNKRFAPVANLLKEKNTTDAFVQLYLLEREAPENDTLAFLKGCCLLEMREGAQALGYFNKIKNKSSWSENIAWYKSLAYLINLEKEKAIQEAELITKNKNQLFYGEAKRLLEVFQ